MAHDSVRVLSPRRLQLALLVLAAVMAVERPGRSQAP